LPPRKETLIMKKTMYSLMLSEDIVAAIDRLAYEAGTSRSNMVNNILAEYVSYRTPEMRIRAMFDTLENLLSACDGFKVMLRTSDSLFNLRSALTYKYNPTMNYGIELYRTVSDAVGELRAGLRTQNPSLKLYIMQFYKLWARLECAYSASPGSQAISGEKFVKKLALNKDRIGSGDLPEEKLCRAIVGYIGAFDGALKAFFYNLDNAAEAVGQAERIYAEYRNGDPLIV